MTHPEFTITSRVWIYDGPAAWHFITLDPDTSREITSYDTGMRRGFGSIPVRVTINKTSWKTSIFPEKKGTYLLPLKKSVRTDENIHAGDTINLRIQIMA